MSDKIRVFLGGYVNYINAQNINCRALSEWLDKDRFEISTMLFPVQNAKDFSRVDEVKYIQLKRPVKLWHYWVYFLGISRADVAYLPKCEVDDFCRLVARIFRTKVFTTVEGMIDGDLAMNGYKKYVNHLSKYEPNLYAITKFISKDVGRRRGYKFADKILYLGVDSRKFVSDIKKQKLRNIIFIGSSPSIKNVYDFFEAAYMNPDIHFHMVGGNELKEGSIEDYIRDHKLVNVIYHGRLDHTELSLLLGEMDLMYFPSRSEGFPKVHLEAACAGVPTLCYGDYGASEWIDSWHNGIVVDNKEEAFDAIKKLRQNSELLWQLSQNTIELSKSFDWANIIKTWESEIIRIYKQ